MFKPSQSVPPASGREKTPDRGEEASPPSPSLKMPKPKKPYTAEALTSILGELDLGKSNNNTPSFPYHLYHTRVPVAVAQKRRSRSFDPEHEHLDAESRMEDEGAPSTTAVEGKRRRFD